MQNFKRIMIRDSLAKTELLIAKCEKTINVNLATFKDEQLVKLASGFEPYLRNPVDKHTLINDYKDCKGSERDNESFVSGIKLRDDLAIKITQHIHVYRLIPEVNFLPWYYVDHKVYIADSWWETDEEILNDFISVPFVDFIIKYRAYGWYLRNSETNN